MLWAVYSQYMPLFLDELLKSRSNRSVEFYADNPHFYAHIIGHIMSLDNLSGILVIPLFSFLSDNTKTKFGKRAPYIFIGGILSIVIFPLIAVVFILNAFVWFFIVVALLVFAMGVWRSPAITLMPDTTPKPSRIKANATINLIGHVGAILGAIIVIIISRLPGADDINSKWHLIPFTFTSFVLALVIVILFLKFPENKIVSEAEFDLEVGEQKCESHEMVINGLSRLDKINFGIIIAVVFFCWFAFSALFSWGSTYAMHILGDHSLWAIFSVVIGVTAIIAFLPSVWLIKQIGRKWSVIFGLFVALCGITTAAFWGNNVGLPLLLPMLVLSGFGWGLMMVAAIPMFAEFSTQKNNGKMIGLYYFVSQGAMLLTANISGYLFRILGYEYYFTYAAVSLAIALIIALGFKSPKTDRSNTNTENQVCYTGSVTEDI